MVERKSHKDFYFPRTTLLMKIDRRCAFPECTTGNQVVVQFAKLYHYRKSDRFDETRSN